MEHLDITCDACNSKLKAKAKLAGRTVPCPQCKSPVTVPCNVPPDDADKSSKVLIRPATEKQKAFARELGIQFADDINRQQISDLIDQALLKQEDSRYERVNELECRESKIREDLRNEILKELDEEDPRLSIATPEQILNAFENRDVGAILVTFDPDEIVDLEDLTGLKMTVETSDNLDAGTVKAVLSWLGVVMMRR